MPYDRPRSRARHRRQGRQHHRGVRRRRSPDRFTRSLRHPPRRGRPGGHLRALWFRFRAASSCWPAAHRLFLGPESRRDQGRRILADAAGNSSSTASSTGWWRTACRSRWSKAPAPQAGVSTTETAKPGRGAGCLPRACRLSTTSTQPISAAPRSPPRPVPASKMPPWMNRCFEEDAEKELFAGSQRSGSGGQTTSRLQRDYAAALEAAASIRPAVDRFFDDGDGDGRRREDAQQPPGAAFTSGRHAAQPRRPHAGGRASRR